MGKVVELAARLKGPHSEPGEAGRAEHTWSLTGGGGAILFSGYLGRQTLFSLFSLFYWLYFLGLQNHCRW